MNVNLYTNNADISSELLDVVRLFYPDCQAATVFDSANANLTVIIDNQGNKYFNSVSFFGSSFENSFDVNADWDSLEIKRYIKRYAKLAVYNCLKNHTQKVIPWGSLTGIRPTKLAYELNQREKSGYKELFTQLFDVSSDKISLVEDILTQQSGLRKTDANAVDIYVGIPFCVSRCSFCSFSSGEIGKLSKFVSPFVDTLIREISIANKMIENNGYSVRNIYFGGGTPTSLSADDLSKILKLFKGFKGEFTVECGRPDTIDSKKLDAMAEFGVNRISINPQSFSQETLDIIGRKHSVEDIYDKFKLARQYNFNINMDLIAGLPSEDLDTFKYSVNSAIALLPDNITVHTLALKRGSRLVEDSAHTEDDAKVSAMIDYSRSALYSANYRPYYLYRQKHVSANLENVGYCLKDKQCQYNIDIMEETTSIVACGCNAISKRVFGAENRIERQANPKDVKTYVEHIDDYIAKKEALFAK